MYPCASREQKDEDKECFGQQPLAVVEAKGIERPGGSGEAGPAPGSEPANEYVSERNSGDGNELLCQQQRERIVAEQTDDDGQERRIDRRPPGVGVGQWFTRGIERPVASLPGEPAGESDVFSRVGRRVSVSGR